MQDQKKNRMHPYIPHLLADTKAACLPDRQAHRSEQGHVDPVNRVEEEAASIEEYLEEVERWIAGEEPEHTFGYYCGLQRSDFPPAEQLNHEDLEPVCRAFEKLLFSWNSGIDLPEKFPLHLRYTFMVNTLDEGFTPVRSGFMIF
jgi:hypothetical protein